LVLFLAKGWKGVILYHLQAHGRLRFGELRRLLPARLTQQAFT
jgi:DNA-binding HxlR family transcriptional regulator